MHKFFANCEMVNDSYATITGDDVKHIYKVLRLNCGDEVVINNEQGKEYLGEIEEITKQYVKVKIIEEIEINSESNLNITLFQGLPKSTKMDLVVQKCTELGVNTFVPIITSRVDVKLKGEFKKLDRLQRIALEACKQCKRAKVPKVLEPIDFKEMIKSLEDMNLVVVPYENATGNGIRTMKNLIKKNALKNVAIIVGPEGGFEEEEIEALEEKKAYIVTLGPRILRTETAGFVCVSLIQYELGDLGGNI
ncbi:16S rRNA (uracil(1498)-N(3))-methyltransferase [Clostridium frigidicarnis]|uniref:Ribosomal RNA small subunit methyltransferase E n=1 Tax=Clostridium frigidicarnis TaxID=84698 RepID=A0A1I0VHV3_9CLOT|nr:16S rRNA (uracil(1498)-N(3))-methyltransferase [Clostridium frigidicarnis]SFA75623.1 16S rRNA (uracil1498-N3)-methyltransferase [Clostridium frigidicarnis]